MIIVLEIQIRSDAKAGKEEVLHAGRNDGHSRLAKCRAVEEVRQYQVSIEFVFFLINFQNKHHFFSCKSLLKLRFDIVLAA